ncbi:AAA family ATPase [Streptomyces sp. NPDC003688]
MTAVFVDREDSLDVLGSVAARLAEGVGSVLIIEADSGMGKTSLLAEFRRRTAAGPCRTVLVSCMPGLGTGREYGPFLDALTELSTVPRPGQRRSRWARAVGRGAIAAAPTLLSAALPGLGELFSAGRAVAEASVTTGSIPGDSLGPIRATMTRQLVNALLEEARDGGPLLLLIDDMEWCDEESLELLHLLLPSLEGEPLALVLSLGAFASATPRGAVVEQMIRGWENRHNLLVARHQVPPLPDWAVGELVRERLPSRPVPTGFAQRLTDVTGGRPVFVEQCLKLWQPGYGAEVPLPEKFPDAVADRFERIDPDVRELLVVGATMGEFFFSHTLAEVTGLPQTRVQDLLLQLERRHGMIRERRRADMPRWARALHVDWYDFEHRALHACVREEQHEGARLLRHSRIADALGKIPRTGDELPYEVRVLIADQLRAAGPARAAESATAYYTLARSAVVEDLSFSQAERYCQSALDSVRQLPEGSPEHDRRLVDAIELLLSITEVRWKGGQGSADTPGIDTLAAEAEAAARRLDDPFLIARTTLLRGKTLLAVKGLNPSLLKLEEAVERARECGPGGNRALFVALVEYGRQLPKRDLEAGLRVLFEAEELYASAPGLGDTADPVLQHARNLNEMQIGVNLFDAGRFGEALQRLERCVDRLRAERYRVELPIALNYLAQLSIALGSEERAESLLMEAMRFEEGLGYGLSGWHAYNNALVALIASRTPARAEEAVRRARDAWAETEQTWLVNLVPIVRNLYAEVLLTVGRERRLALRLIDDTLAETAETGMDRSRIAAHCLRSRGRLLEGRPEEAAEDARLALAILEERGTMPALRTEEVFYEAHRALTAAAAHAEAAGLLERARDEVLRKAGGIDEPEARERFLTGVPLNRALLGAIGEYRAEDPGVTVPDQGESRTGE